MTLPDGFEISTDPGRIDLDTVCAFLATSYWAKNRSRDTIARSLQHSICFGVYRDGAQVGFARVVTDRAVIAYLADVFVSPEYRGMGIGTALVQTILAMPELQEVRWFLGTRDAQALYARLGFAPIQDPGRWMIRFPPGTEPFDDVRP